MEINENTTPGDVLVALNRGEMVTYRGHEINDVTLYGKDCICCIFEEDGRRKQVIV